MMTTLQLVGVLLFVLLSVAFFSLFERKLLGASQLRRGPNKVLGWGWFQPIYDAMKLVSKSQTSPMNTVSIVYFLLPSLVMMLMFGVWCLFPSKWGFMEICMDLVCLLIYFSVSVYGTILMGWFSNSKYAILGCVRAISQSISYEIGLTLLLVCLIVISSSLSMWKIIEIQEMVWLIWPALGLSLTMVIILLAETYRTPFDLPEGESELVSGYSVEYGGLGYTLVFLSETSALIWACKILSVLFTGNSDIVWFFWLFLFVIVRSTLPRFRFDKMMTVVWKELLPISVGICFLYLIFSI